MALIIFLLAVFFLYAVPNVFNWWKLYERAGRPGWAILVPVYSNMVMADIGGKPLWMGVLVGASAYADTLFKPFSLVALIFGLIILNGFIKKYDRGIGFWAVILFLPFIGIFIVDRANYSGGQPVATAGIPPTGMPPVAPNGMTPAASPISPAPPTTPTMPSVAAPIAPTQQVPSVTPPVPPQPPVSPIS